MKVFVIGVGINLLPHAIRELTLLGLEAKLAAIGVDTGELTSGQRCGIGRASRRRSETAFIRLRGARFIPTNRRS